MFMATSPSWLTQIIALSVWLAVSEGLAADRREWVMLTNCQYVVETHSRGTLRASGAIYPGSAGLSRSVRHLGYHTARCPGLSRGGTSPFICATLAHRTVIPRHQNFLGHESAALQKSQDAAQGTGNVFHRLQ